MTVARADRHGGLSDGDDVECRVAEELVSDSENFERAGKVENFDIWKEKNGYGFLHGI